MALRIITLRLPNDHPVNTVQWSGWEAGQYSVWSWSLRNAVWSLGRSKWYYADGEGMIRASDHSDRWLEEWSMWSRSLTPLYSVHCYYPRTLRDSVSPIWRIYFQEPLCIKSALFKKSTHLPFPHFTLQIFLTHLIIVYDHFVLVEVTLSKTLTII